MSLHPLLQFGEIDAALLAGGEKTGRAVTVCIYKSTVLQNKDRVACQVFDGGTAYALPADGVAYGVRLVMRAQAMDLRKIAEGLIVRLAPDTVVHTLKSGEKVFDCYSCELVESWPGMKRALQNVANNPLSKPNPPTEPVYQPPAAKESTASLEQSLLGDFSDSSGAYAPERAARPSAVQRAGGSGGPAGTSHAEPYAPVKQRPAGIKYLQISDLNTYVDKWRILARVTNKSDIREYRNARGDGKLFSVDLIDAEGVEIKGTFFNEAVDRFYPILRKNVVYSFARGQIKAANPRFKKFDHLCELTFGLDAEISEEDPAACGGSNPGIPLATLKPRPLAEVDAVELDVLLDIVCLIYQAYDTGQITVRSTGNRKDKRSLMIIDKSEVLVPVTLWGTDCQLLPPGSWSQKQPPAKDTEYYLAIRKAKIDEFNGRKLGTSTGNVHVYVWEGDARRWRSGGEDCENIEPQLVPGPIRELQEWVAQQKLTPGGIQGTRLASSGPSGPVRQYHTIGDMLNECQAMSNEQLTSGAYFHIVASIVETSITPHRNYFWAACGGCGKKLQGGPDAAADSFGGSGMAAPYSCAQCNVTVEEPERKYNFTLDIQDHTNTVRLSALGDAGKDLFGGRAANELETLKQRTGPNGEEFQDVIQGLRRQELLFKVVARNDTWQDETRIKYRLQGAQKLQGDSLVSYLGKQKELIESLL